MRFARVFAIVALGAGLAAPAVAGGLLVDDQPGNNQTPGSAPRQNIVVLVRDVSTGELLTGVHGSLWTISTQGERPTLISSAMSGRTGRLYLPVSGRRGDAYTLVVQGFGYDSYSETVFLGANTTTTTEAELFESNASPGKDQGPQDAPGVTATTWGGIKALY